MIRSYSTRTKQFETVDTPFALRMNSDVVWIDLLSPTEAEEKALEQMLGIDLPTHEEMRDIEPSSRLYTDRNAQYMTASLLVRGDTEEPSLTDIAFILHAGRLITIRYEEPRPFAMFLSYAERHEALCTSAHTTMLFLLDAIIDRTAEVLEKTGADVDNLTRQVFARKHGKAGGQGAGALAQRTAGQLEMALADIALYQTVTSKARDSLGSLSRMVSFLMLDEELSAGRENREHLKTISRDLIALSDQAAYLSNTMTFLLDACLGLISIDQNAIIKIFSVAAVIFLPPTLVASIYGMNFHYMPELQWHYGYPVGLCIMIMAAVLPYLYFKHKKWL